MTINKNKYFWLLTIVSLLSFQVSADGVITNGTTIRVHSGTYFIETGNRSVQNNAVFDIWGFVTINGLLSNLGDYNGIIVESDINGTGSLIYSSGTPEAKVERYLTDNMWHMIGASTSDVLTGQYFYNNSPTVWLKNYDESIDDYTYITSLSLAMNQGKGFAYWVGNSKTDVVLEIHGDLTSESLSLSTATNPSLEYTNSRYNLIANPYASAIDWDDPNWSFSEMEESIWIWDPLYGGGNFKERNSSGVGDDINIVPSSQGFYVRVSPAATSPSVTIPAQARTHDSHSFYKSQNEFNEALSFIKIKVHKGNYWDDVTVGFHEEATEGFDNGIDISKFMGVAEAPQLYLVEQEDIQLTYDITSKLINGEPRYIPMHFQAAENTTYFFNMIEKQQMDGVQIFLEDLLYDDLHELNINEELSIEASINDDYDRFILHFNPINTSENNLSQDDNVIYSYDKSIYINLNEKWSSQNKTVFVYDVSGKLLYSENLGLGDFYKIPTQVRHQSIVVQVLSAQNSLTKKLMLL